MQYTHLSRRLLLRRILLAAALLSGCFAPSAVAQEAAKTTLILRPHCETDTADCPTYEVEDPTSLRTEPLKSTDTLDMDLVLFNPQKKKINHVRAWLLYNPATLAGKSIDVGTALPVAAPGEKDFSDEEGFAKIDLSPEAGKEPAEESILLARIQFTIRSVPPGNTDVLAFYDVQVSGHTLVTALGTNGQNQHILTEDPSQLLVTFDPASSGTGSSASSAESLFSAASESSAASMESQASSIPPDSGGVCGNGIIEEGEECDDGNFLKGDGCSQTCTLETGAPASSRSSQASARSLLSAQPDGSACEENEECGSGLCSSGICRGDTLKVENGGTCNVGTQCISGSCTAGKCVMNGSASSVATGGTGPFGILQVRNVRVTSQGSTVFLAWDALASAQLNGYNVYYGTTSGRYLQRKTVDRNTKLIDIRALPEGTTYYFAVRGVSGSGEESAFSQEVAVEVGKPQSSTSPLTGNLLNLKKPLQTSDTGLPSGLALLLLVSAVTGTLFASRRQLATLSHGRIHD